MGWSDSKKRRQLTEPEARLLVVSGSVRSPYPAPGCCSASALVRSTR